MSRWQAHFEGFYPAEVGPGALPHPAALALARLLTSGEYGGGRLVCCRTGDPTLPSACLLLVEVEVSLGQRPPVADIRPVEPMTFEFRGDDALPSAYPLRDDFPVDVPHLNLAKKDNPRSLCLFEVAPDEALRLATPYIFVERVRFWLKETAHGRLHGDDQPLDPIFINGWQPVVLPNTAQEPGSFHLLQAFKTSEHAWSPLFMKAAAESEQANTSRSSLAAVVFVTKPLSHARLRMVPLNVAELLEAFQELGADLVANMRAALGEWTSKPNVKDLLGKCCLLVVRTPIERSPGVIGGEAAKGFLTNCTFKHLAETIGAIWAQGEHVGRPLTAPPLDMEAVRKLTLYPMDVHRSFSRRLAKEASGLGALNPEPISVTLIGAGALGSQIAVTAAKMGLGRWTIVDPDHILPHNMARHALSSLFVGRPKAEALAYEINHLLGDEATATAVVGRVGQDEQAGAAVSSVGLVIDASASVSAARWLGAASAHSGRTASVFLNPKGTDLVILAEGENRTPRIDHVEMSYYWALVNGTLPEDHLMVGRVGMYPSGGCRTPSLAISQVDVGALAPLAAKRLLQDKLPADGVIEVRRTSDEGVAVLRSTPARYREAGIGEWTVAISEELIQGVRADRDSAGHLETGGILVGSWDRARKRVYVVGHYAPPPDSIQEPTGFVRGESGVHETLETVQHRTAGNLTYIGEWHTHPVGLRSRPSTDDRILLRWIGRVLAYSDVPPLMLIAGEDGIRVMVGTTEQGVVITVEPRRGVADAA